MILEQGTSYAQLKEIREIIRKFEAPPDADAFYHSLCTSLSEFEAEMEERTFLEDDLIFPKAIALERVANGLSRQSGERKETE